MLLWALASAFGLTVAALIAVDLVSWSRTRALRRGIASRAPPFDHNQTWPSGPVHSSRATFLAAAAGLLAMGWGVAALIQHHPVALAALAGGGFVAMSGLRSRVASIDVLGAGVRVRFAGRRPAFCSWASIRSLRAARTPIGPWRLDWTFGNVTLMPSDVLGNERVLESMIALAALTFDGRTWRRLHQSVPG